MMKGLKPLFFIFILTVAFNLFLVPGKVVVQIWILKITEEGIRQAIKIGIRLIYLVMGSSVMTLTTTPNQLTDGLDTLTSNNAALNSAAQQVADGVLASANSTLKEGG